MATAAPLAPAAPAARPTPAEAPAALRRVSVAELAAPAGRARWQRLADRASEPNPFNEAWYLLPALAALDPAGEARVMVLESGGEWLGLVPLARSPRYYGRPIPHVGNWLHGNAFLGAPLVAQGAEQAFWHALLAHADAAPGAALFLHLADLPLDGPLAAALREVCTTQRRPLGLVHREERALLASSLAPDAYLETALTGKKRKELRRQHARLSEQGRLDMLRQRDEADLAEWTARFLALEAAGWKGRTGSALAGAPATAALFTEALAGAAALGKLERLTLTLDGRPPRAVPGRAGRLFSGWSANLVQMVLGITQQVALIPVFLHYWTGDTLAAWLAIYAIGNLVFIADAGLQFRAINRFLQFKYQVRRIGFGRLID